MGLCGEAQNVGRWQKINVESRMQINDCPHRISNSLISTGNWSVDFMFLPYSLHGS